MLEMTLATDFIPGSNLKGRVAGANWLFLLPQLELGRVFCLGMPTLATLTTLSNFSDVVVVAADETLGETAVSPSVHSLTIDTNSIVPLPTDSVDLILIDGPENGRHYFQNEKLQVEFARILSPKGVLFSEWRESGVLGKMPERDSQYQLAQTFWLTPIHGEVHTAVSHQDNQTISYFLQHGLHSPMFNLQTKAIQQVKQLRSKNKKNGSVKRPLNAPMPTQNKKGGRKLSRKKMRKAAVSLMDKMQQAETWLDNHRPVRRYGRLIGNQQTDLTSAPPKYMRDLAAEAGIDLSNFRWGLSAKGDYSSRKLLFFLFEGNNSQPTYIVKMVRDGIYNYRLDNEAQALNWLHANQVADSETLPQVVFSGHHAGLSIVGESIIAGRPFRNMSHNTATCPYAQSALDWLVDLGAETKVLDIASPSEIAASLYLLLTRFVEVYEPTEDQRAFLVDQIERIRQSETAVPLVFQHGDPGPWNMFVTPGGRVAVLDWEAAEQFGMPLWDLFYFMRSYSLDVGEKQGKDDRIPAFTRQFLADTPLSQLFVETLQRYCEVTKLDPSLVEPLFYTCWMHRALKEVTRISPGRLQYGHFFNLIWHCRNSKQSPTLKQIQGLEIRD